METLRLKNEARWLGLPLKGGPVLAYFCEDDGGELHRRQLAINTSLGVIAPKESLRHFHMVSRVGMDNLLMTFEGDNGRKTPFYDQIVNDIKSLSAGVVILDNVAQMFGGNENSRAQVTKFVGLLHRLGQDTQTTVLLLGHPSKGDGSEYSGSTAWDACFRSRLYFGYPRKCDSEGDEEKTRVLRHSKSNYSQKGGELKVRWLAGAFTLVEDASSSDNDTREGSARSMFLSLLEKLTREGRHVSDSKNSSRYAPKEMANMPANGGFSKAEFERAMKLLLHEGAIKANGNPLSNNKKTFGLVRVSEYEAL